jgi:hypothetical protein
VYMQLLLQMESSKYYTTWVFMCSPKYPAWNAQAPLCLPRCTNFSTLSHKRHDFQQNIFGHKMCVWIPSTILFETFFILRRIGRDIFKNVYWCSCIVYIILLSDFNESWIFSTDFQKLFKYKISWKYFHCQPSCSMRTDGRKDMTKLIVAFCHFSKAPKKEFF